MPHGHRAFRVGGIDRGLRERFRIGQVVRLKRPFDPLNPYVKPRGTSFRCGIIAEILEELPDGVTRNVSVYLFDPAHGMICLESTGMPLSIDLHCSALEEW